MESDSTSQSAAGGISELQPDGVREVVACPLCSGTRYVPATSPIPDILEQDVNPPFRGMLFQMARCTGCGLHYQRIRPKREDIGRFYGSDYFCYEPLSERGLVVRLLARLAARQLMRKIERHRPRTADLFVDFGCGCGSWLEMLRGVDAPWKMVGTEIALDLVRRVEELGFPAHVCDDSTIQEIFEAGSVGVFYMNHVIEHLHDPRGFLEKLRGLLVPGGIVVGQTPDQGCLERRVFKDYWTQWHLPQHLVVFDKNTLADLAARAGLEVVEISSSPSGASQWGASMLHYAARRRERTYRATREPLHPYLTLLFLPVALVQCLVGGTSHMDFVLRRPASGGVLADERDSP